MFVPPLLCAYIAMLSWTLFLSRSSSVIRPRVKILTNRGNLKLKATTNHCARVFLYELVEFIQYWTIPQVCSPYIKVSFFLVLSIVAATSYLEAIWLSYFVFGCPPACSCPDLTLNYPTSALYKLLPRPAFAHLLGLIWVPEDPVGSVSSMRKVMFKPAIWYDCPRMDYPFSYGPEYQSLTEESGDMRKGIPNGM